MIVLCVCKWGVDLLRGMLPLIFFCSLGMLLGLEFFPFLFGYYSCPVFACLYADWGGLLCTFCEGFLMSCLSPFVPAEKEWALWAVLF